MPTAARLLAPFLLCAAAFQMSCQVAGPRESVAPSVKLPAPLLPEAFSPQEQLRGSITPERAWWNLLHYDLKLRVDLETKSLKGSNKIRFLTLESGKRMQVDLQEPPDHHKSPLPRPGTQIRARRQCLLGRIRMDLGTRRPG